LRAQILVVDDHAPSCELISEILRSAGFEANSLTSSAEAAERLTRDKFHAVFMDMRMPPPDGLELARKVRSSPLNASTVIVMITGEQDRTLMKRAFEIGVQFFLFKPVERNKLLKLIRVAETRSSVNGGALRVFRCSAGFRWSRMIRNWREQQLISAPTVCLFSPISSSRAVQSSE
jgi:PleD family two-component response regulator